MTDGSARPDLARTVSILGCGWMGLPLGRRLAAEGYAVRGATTTPAKLDVLRDAGIRPYRLVLDPDWQTPPGDFFDAHVLVLNVPPPRGMDDAAAYHRQQIEHVLRALRGAPVRHVLFASSTGVYPGGAGRVTEGDVPPGAPAPDGLRPTGAALRTVEGLLMDAPGIEATIVRLGGLYGYGRHPARYLAGRTNLSGGGRPVNLIHRDDAVGIARAVLEQQAWGEVFNACADAHPPRREIYPHVARRMGLEPPTFAEEGGGAPGGKRVSSRHVRQRLGYRFRHPDPRAEAP